MKYSKEDIEFARNADLVDVLTRLGYSLKQHSGEEYYISEHDSLKIHRKKGWYWNSREVGGNSIDFFMTYENYSFHKSVDTILDTINYSCPQLTSEFTHKKNSVDINFCGKNKACKNEGEGELQLPEKYKNENRVIDYLSKERRINYDLILSIIKSGNLYESSKFHNCVFIGCDYDGNVKYAFERGTIPDKRFVREVQNSDKRYNFRIDGNSRLLHVFESAIDLLSFITICIEKDINVLADNFIALSGGSLIALDEFMIHKGKNIDTIYVRTDNDNVGRKIFSKIQVKYEDLGYEVIDGIPNEFKDYNDWLRICITNKEGV